MQSEWWYGLLGGALIGLAAALLFVGTGRIAGISGISFARLTHPLSDHLWRALFLAGLLLAPWLAISLGLGQATRPGSGELGGWALIAAAGLLVGFGTRLGNGCTSGHGVCGVSRLSPRSLIATATFMMVGIITASWLRPLLIAIEGPGQ